MGRGMAGRLAKLSEVAVWARNRARADDGRYRWCASPREVGTRSDVVVLMLSTAAATREVLEGPEGLLAGLARGAAVVNAATVGPDATREIAAAVTSRGIDYLDAPVLGTREPAAEGQLLFVVGGDATVMARCAPAFEVMGRGTVHLGDIGAGSAAKLVVNALLAAGMAAFADARRLGDALGVPGAFLLQQVFGSPVVPAALHDKRPLLEGTADDVQFPLKWMLKDIGLATEAGARHGARVPVLESVRERFAEAVADGLGDRDFSAIARPGDPKTSA